jgi:NADPH:quinone reductase-like Zn-dependent oxidoreductase
VSVDQAQVLALPDAMTFEQGAALVVNYATAYAGLVMMGGLREGDRMLIQAAAGGVGIAAIQIGKRIGAEVFGTASAPKHEAIRAQGCDHPIDYHAVDFADEVMRISGGEGVDVVMDAIGPSSFRKSYRILRQGGRLIMFGYAEALPGDRRNIPALVKGLTRMPLATLPWWKSLAMMNENKGVFGLNMLSWWDREGLDRLIPRLAQGLAAGEYDPIVAASFRFDQAGDAHSFLADGRNIGKVVLTP